MLPTARNVQNTMMARPEKRGSSLAKWNNGHGIALYNLPKPMIQILHIPGIQYEGETSEQATERDQRVTEANRRLMEEWKESERQRTAPMRSMQKWAEKRGINRHNAKVVAPGSAVQKPELENEIDR